MFYGASAFNQPIGGWNVDKVTDMGWMFRGASAFNQPIGGWRVDNVTNMGCMKKMKRKNFGSKSSHRRVIEETTL